jgi:protein translocase SEC61 complex gamma subunit
MGIKSFLAQCARTLKLAVKPGREELWLSIKISVLGIGVVGIVGFAIKFIASALMATNVIYLVTKCVSFALGGV